MTAPQPRLGALFAASLLTHAAVLVLLVALSGRGGAGARVSVYTVRIVEAPELPQARQLDLSPVLRRELRLESPTLSRQAPPLPPEPAPDVTGREAPPPTRPSPRPTPPPPPPPPRAAAPALPVPPALPAQPQPKAAPRSGGAEPAAPPEEGTLMERARRRVEAVAPVAPGTAVPGAAEPESGEGGRERGFVSLRLWQNSVRERVKRNYSFPGTFPPGLRARVRIAVDRGGTFLSAELVESSGNGRFDNLVCLAAVRNTRYPPLPKAVEEDTHTFFLTCTP